MFRWLYWDHSKVPRTCPLWWSETVHQGRFHFESFGLQRKFIIKTEFRICKWTVWMLFDSIFLLLWLAIPMTCLSPTPFGSTIPPKWTCLVISGSIVLILVVVSFMTNLVDSRIYSYILVHDFYRVWSTAHWSWSEVSGPIRTSLDFSPVQRSLV